MTMSRDGVSMDPTKVSTIKDYQAPRDVKGVWRFLGMANFYRRFIPEFAGIAKPLTDLTKKDHTFQWGVAEQRAFDTLKHTFVTAPVLAYPDPHSPLRVETDASAFAIGAALSMKCTDGEWRPCAYYSHALSGSELNWSVYDKELYAILKAFEQWRHWLLPAQHCIEVWCDHQNLAFYRRPQTLTQKQARWYTTLQEYSFEVIPKPGSANAQADALSRRDELLGEEGIAEPVVMLPMRSELSGPEPPKPSHVRRVMIDTEFAARVRAEAENEQPPGWFDRVPEGWKTGSRLYVPTKLRVDLMTQMHDHPAGGHFGTDKTHKRILEYYTWPGSRKDVKAFVQRCSVCAQTKHSTRRPAGSPTPLTPAKAPWQDVTVDLVTDLPEDKGYTGVCTVVDRFSKEIVLFPTTKHVTALDLAQGFRDHVWKRHGTPQSVLSDRGPQFASSFTQALCKLLGIRSIMSATYPPQTYGQTERTQQTWQRYLRAYVGEDKQWVDSLSTLEFAYNSSFHRAVGQPPFHVTRTYRPRIGNEPQEVENRIANQWAADYQKRLDLARKCSAKTQESMRAQIKRTPT